MSWFTLDLFAKILMVVGAIVTALGWADESTVQTAIGVVMTLATAVWSLFDRNKVETEVKSLRNEVKSLKGLK